MFRDIGQLVLLFWRTLAALPLVWRQRRKVAEQFHEIGNASLLMVCILAAFIGGVLALEVGPTMVERGLANFLGGIIGFALCRELAPVMMAVLISGRIGSAMAAEIGSMAVYQEIDALRTMNINPIHYLVLPRMVAICIALPMLVIFADLVGWWGGALVCATNPHIAISQQAFFANLRDVVEIKDLMHGIYKSIVFAVTIGTVSCAQGLRTIGGPRGIGRSVTKAVVNSIILILILDYFVTNLLTQLEK
ncbi:MAG: ABC transporter permease [Verrucomicrobia bacterium]|nr:ABC transporter permease [Verrucomicrobiota bacterium]